MVITRGVQQKSSTEYHRNTYQIESSNVVYMFTVSPSVSDECLDTDQDRACSVIWSYVHACSSRCAGVTSTFTCLVRVRIQLPAAYSSSTDGVASTLTEYLHCGSYGLNPQMPY